MRVYVHVHVYVCVRLLHVRKCVLVCLCSQAHELAVLVDAMLRSTPESRPGFLDQIKECRERSYRVTARQAVERHLQQFDGHGSVDHLSAEDDITKVLSSRSRAARWINSPRTRDPFPPKPRVDTHALGAESCRSRDTPIDGWTASASNSYVDRPSFADVQSVDGRDSPVADVAWAGRFPAVGGQRRKASPRGPDPSDPRPHFQPITKASLQGAIPHNRRSSPVHKHPRLHRPAVDTSPSKRKPKNRPAAPAVVQRFLEQKQLLAAASANNKKDRFK